MALLDELNQVQRQAVEYTDGPSMIIAGAGSGKTRVITYKIAHLLEKGANPFSIMALTFTNKAAREMRERVEKLIGNTEARSVWLGTFHSIFARILRQEAEHLGFTKHFTIYDTDDSKSLMRNILRSQELSDKIYKVNTILGRISSAKTNLISHIEYNNNQDLLQVDYQAGRPKTGLIYTLYQESLKKANAMDFDDLLFNTNILFRDFPEVLYKYQKIFKYVLVDEYQDTNYAQYLIVKKLAAHNENITVVGDDAQSIYAFRGANIQNILNIERDYPDLKTFKLEQNYRSTQNIVNVANSIIEKNKNQFRKKIWTENGEGDKVVLFNTTTDNEEGNMVARHIFDVVNKERVTHDKIAILYRTNAQSRALEEALRRLNIPYKIFGGMSFYKRKEIKDLLAYFRLVINPLDQEALLRVINLPKRGIGATSLDKLKIFADQNGISLWDAMSKRIREAGLPGPTAIKIFEFTQMIEALRIEVEKKDAFEMATEIGKASGLMQMLYQERNDDEGIMRFENVEELLNGIQDFCLTELGEEEEPTLKTLPVFMEDIALYTDADDKDKQDGEFVSLMTIHAAKGLEFPYVFIVGLEENLFPSIMAINSREELEEERRLFYVALTRGEKKVFLSFARMRYKYGSAMSSEPSRFLMELNADFIQDDSGLITEPADEPLIDFEPNKKVWSNKPARRPITNPDKSRLKKMEEIAKSEPTSSGNQSADYKDIVPGAVVQHQRFGKGKVLSVEGLGADAKAVVFFNNFGNKTLILRFARLDIL